MVLLPNLINLDSLFIIISKHKRNEQKESKLSADDTIYYPHRDTEHM